MKNKILKVKIETLVDENPDTSWLGEYSRNAGEHAIDRVERGDAGRGEYRYFNPCNHLSADEWNHVNVEDTRKEYVRLVGPAHELMDKDEMADAVNAKYREQDYQRMQSLCAGNWHFVGIIAKAEVQLVNNGPFQTIRSGGLWGIESDCGKEHKAEVIRDELASLRTELEAIGFGKRAIDYAFKNVTD